MNFCSGTSSNQYHCPFQLDPKQFEPTKPMKKKRKYRALISSTVKACSRWLGSLPPSQFQYVVLSGRNRSAPGSRWRSHKCPFLLSSALCASKFVSQVVDVLHNHQGSSQRSQGVAGRYALTVDVPLPLRLQKCRYAFDVFILLVFSSGRESILSESQVHEIRRAR